MPSTCGICCSGCCSDTVLTHRGRDYRVRVTTRKRGAGLRESVVHVPSPLVFESQEEAERHARYLMLAVKGVRPSGKPEYTVI